jgi:hypothetical protein
MKSGGQVTSALNIAEDPTSERHHSRVHFTGQMSPEPKSLIYNNIITWSFTCRNF